MYFAAGKEKYLSSGSVIGIFDLDITSQSHLTRKYLSAADRAGKVINAAEDIPRSFIVCAENGENRVYLSQASTATLVRHIEEDR